MSSRLHLFEIALTAALVAAPAIAVFGQKSAPARALPPVPAVPTKYDFQWETYTVNAARDGKAFYVFEGPEPVGIGVLGADGKPEIFPIVFGAAAEELKASFKRYQKANGAGAVPLSKASTVASITTPPLPATSRDGTPRVAFDANGSHVWLSRGTSVDFLAASIEVTMPAAIPSLPATRIIFSSQVKGGTIGQVLGETGITVNGKPIDWQRKGPLWDGLKALVLKLALGRAAQAATIAGNAPARPADAPDYVALVADIEKHLD